MSDERRGRRHRWRRFAVAAGLIGLAGFLWVAIANAYLLGSTRAAIVDDVAGAPSRPFVIVLGNRVFPGGVPCWELAERLATGRALYRAGRAGKVIVSGLVRGDGYDEPQAMAAWLVARGVPRADVVIDGGGYRTAATMADAAKLGVRGALIATQAYHLPRALYLARLAGVDAVGVPARSPDKSLFQSLRTDVREGLARAEIIPEVALRGVRGSATFIANQPALR